MEKEREVIKVTQISQALLDEWKAQAKKDGNLDDYKYHLGMIYPPLPYQQWKLKFDKLNHIQATPGYLEGENNPTLDRLSKQADRLCAELGY